jgi:hypothetical protein
MLRFSVSAPTGIAALAIAALATLAPSAVGEIIDTPIDVYEDANRDPVTVPFHLGGAPNNKLFARFNVPQGQLIESLNAFTVHVTAHDDDDPAGESADVMLGAGQNEILLGEIVNPPNGGQVYTFDLDPVHFDEAIASIQNNDRVPIQIQKTSRDFIIDEVALEVDAVLIPEPASLALLLGGALLLARRRR